MTRAGMKKFHKIVVNTEGQTIEVPVWVVHPDIDEGQDISFEARYEPANINIRDKDINKLKEIVTKKIREWYTITWELFIRVNITYGTDYTRYHISLEIEYFLIGETFDGKKVHMEVPKPESIKADGSWDGKWDAVHRHTGRYPKDGLPETESKRRDTWGEAIARSLIPASIENVRAVIKFERALKLLAEEIRKRFAPKSINETLGAILKTRPLPPMLPAGKPADEEE